MITHLIHPWNMDSFLSFQLQCLKTTFFKREVTLRVSEIYGEVLLLHLSKFIIVIIITIIVFPIIIMVRFQRNLLCSICIWLSLYLQKKCCKSLRKLSKREHIKLFATGPVLN